MDKFEIKNLSLLSPRPQPKLAEENSDLRAAPARLEARPPAPASSELDLSFK